MTAIYPKPPYPSRWWETPLYWPADVAGGLRWVLRPRFGTARLHDLVEQGCMAAIEGLDRQGRQHGMLCPCTQGPEGLSPHAPDAGCEICWGAGFIYIDGEGNVIGNFDLEEAEEDSSIE